MRNEEQVVTVVSRAIGGKSPCKCKTTITNIHDGSTVDVYGKQLCGNHCCGECKEASSTSFNKFSNFSDWGGISFQCDETPFTSATGNKETLLGGGGDRAIGGGKKNYTCICFGNLGGEVITNLYTITAHSSMQARRRCSRYGKGCFLESSYGV